jgi:Protein of unknown function (DUF4013)
MEIGKGLSESLEYAKEAVWGKWVKWILLIVSTIIFPLILGYELEVYRGKKPAPELENWGKLFIDGLKLFIIQLIYAIPVIIVAVIFIGTGVFLLVSSPDAWMAAAGSFIVGFILTLIVAIIIGLVEMMGVVRFARKGSMGEAFNFSAIFETIGKIGWLDYIFALVALFMVVFIIVMVLSLIPWLGPFLILIFSPFIAIFTARYICMLYDSAPQAA